MAEVDWTAISDSLDGATVARGVVTDGVTFIPNGGGSFAYGMNSKTTTAGTVALYAAGTGFDPMAKGGIVSAGVMRGVSAAATGFAPFLFLCLGGTSSADQAYILGLANADPGHVVLRKGSLAGGVPDVAPGAQGVLRRSTSSYARERWVHLRLNAIVEPNGDVLLQVFENDLDANDIDTPSWVAIAGMSQVTDDALGIVTGSSPLTSGRGGFGSVFSNISRRVYFDQVVLERQL